MRKIVCTGMSEAYLFDSHGFMPKTTVYKSDTETEREFKNRTWYMFLDLCRKWDGYNGTGNTVYMRYYE